MLEFKPENEIGEEAENEIKEDGYGFDGEKFGDGEVGGDGEQVEVRGIVVGEVVFERGKAIVSLDEVVPGTEEGIVVTGLDGVE
jgi:hypothetical protein